MTTLPANIWNRAGRVPAQINLAWGRIVFSRLTIAYFLFSVVHCVSQVAFQAQAFRVDKNAASSLFSVVAQSNATVPGFLVLGNDLRHCSQIPDTMSVASCEVIWPLPIQANASSPQPSEAAALDAEFDGGNNPNLAVAFPSTSQRKIMAVNDDLGQTISDPTCLTALNYPVMILDNIKREDITFIVFQVWVLGMSAVALLNESVPHIMASLLTHVMATGWAGIQIYRGAAFHNDFTRIITNGACSSSSAVFLQHYWSNRIKTDIPILAFNVVALLISSAITWKLLKSFGWQTFKHMGASRSVNRMYMTVLLLSITIQLALFFMAVTLGTWIDQLINGAIGQLADLKTFYMGLFIGTLILLIPWLVLGWVAARRELKVPMVVFLVISTWFFAGWGGMFLSTSFRWTFMTWWLFAFMACASVLLSLVSFILGLICWRNFDRGLREHLVSKETLPGQDFVPVYPTSKDIEKGDRSDFSEAPIPTYSRYS